MPNRQVSGHDVVVATERVVRLSSPGDAGLGGKAGNLFRLLRLGFPVPDGWVVTLDAGRRWRAGTLSDEALDVAVRAVLSADGVFAVRSSADTEDSARASYAGQFRTELHVSRDDVPQAVRQVLLSMDNPAALAYARRLGVAAPTAMAVLVQEQLAPVLSGVCFTVHPVTHEPAMVLDYAHGLGDAVAGGGAPDGTHVLPRQPDGSVAPEHWLGVDARLADVVALAAAVEAASGGPQDVEWAIDDRGLWLLQARPVTGRVRG